MSEEGFKQLRPRQAPDQHSQEQGIDQLTERFLAAPLPPVPDAAGLARLGFIVPEGGTVEDAWAEHVRSNRRLVIADWSPTGVLLDAHNIWTSNIMWIDAGGGEEMIPARTYREFLDEKYRFDPASIEYIMERTGPERIAQADSLAAEFNPHLERMRAGEKEALDVGLEIAQRGLELIRGGSNS